MSWFLHLRHSRAGGNLFPLLLFHSTGIPAFAGMSNPANHEKDEPPLDTPVVYAYMPSRIYRRPAEILGFSASNGTVDTLIINDLLEELL